MATQAGHASSSAPSHAIPSHPPLWQSLEGPRLLARMHPSTEASKGPPPVLKVTTRRCVVVEALQ